MSLGSNQRFSIAKSSGTRFEFSFLLAQALCIDSVICSGDMRYSSISGRSSPLSFTNKSYAVFLIFFFSTPKDVAQFPCGSKSMSNTFAGGTLNLVEPLANAVAKLTAVVVFAQPPF